MRKNKRILALFFCLFTFIASHSIAGDQDIKVEFSADPLNGGEIREGEYAAVSFRITDASTGKPKTSLRPAAWIELREKDKSPSCSEAAGAYLKGSPGMRPHLDLNRYFILVLNRDATISVIDPILGVKGITRLYAMIALDKPGEDWAMSGNGDRLFVTMPGADQLAVVDTSTFKVIDNISAGHKPTRVALQPDGRYLWIGNDSDDTTKSGVTVVDTEELKVAARIATGAGHHELAFSADSRHAFVTNEQEGTLSVIDTATFRKRRDVRIGGLPVAAAFSDMSKAVYVADGNGGSIAVVDAKAHDIVGRVATAPGLKSIRFSPDGRWGFAVNTRDGRVYVLDAIERRIAHIIDAGGAEGAPDHVAFTKKSAYIRLSEAQEVVVVQLDELAQGSAVAANRIALGRKEPAPRLPASRADSLFPGPEGDVMLIVNPADSLIYYHREGMQSPQGSFRNYGQEPRAVRVVDRGIRETADGVYSAKVKVPKSGDYRAVFFLDAPRTVECFELSAAPNADLAKRSPGPQLRMELLTKQRKVKTGEQVTLQFRLIDAFSGTPKDDIGDVIAIVSPSPGLRQERHRARPVGDGVYETTFGLARPGAYYVLFASPSQGAASSQLPYLILQAIGKQGGASMTSDTKESGKGENE